MIDLISIMVLLLYYLSATNLLLLLKRLASSRRIYCVLLRHWSLEHLLLLKRGSSRQLLDALGLAAAAGEPRLFQLGLLLHVELASRRERQLAVRDVLHFLVLDQHILGKSL